MAGYYWYGNKQKGLGHPPKWIETVLNKYKMKTQRHCWNRTLAYPRDRTLTQYPGVPSYHPITGFGQERYVHCII